RGMPGDSSVTVVTTLVCFFISHTRLRAQRAPGIPCALCWQRVRFGTTWVIYACGNAKAWLKGSASSAFVIPGCAERRRPGIHGTATMPGEMDSGFDASHRPGMTKASCLKIESEVVPDKRAPGNAQRCPERARSGTHNHFD